LLGENIGIGKYASRKRWVVDGGIVDHPKGVYVEELRKVPWVEIHSDNRPKIKSCQPSRSDEIEQKQIEDRLKALGYR